MIEIDKNQKYIFLTYYYEESFYRPDQDWVVDDLNRYGVVRMINRAFTLTSGLIENKLRLQIAPIDFMENFPNVKFKIGELTKLANGNTEDEYFKIYPNVLVEDKEIYLHKDFDCDIRYFVAERNISIFKQISDLVKGDIIIGGILPHSVPLEEFYQLIENFPTTHEKKLYAQSRISSVLRNYFEDVKDSNALYVKYRNKKSSKHGIGLAKLFEEYEAEKFQTIYEKLLSMLENEESYNETTWQKEIIDILLLLYPKYIAVFKEVSVNVDDIKKKFLDFLFVDANGHVDIVEIKQPFDHKIMTKGLYRGNHIPLRELSGTVMQIEKYVYYLNRWGKRGETILSEKYKNQLPDNFKIHITNPKGFIIMGRENNLSPFQKHDFEVVKRKYKNVIDILSYDDLLQRLKFTIEQIRLR